MSRNVPLIAGVFLVLAAGVVVPRAQAVAFAEDTFELFNDAGWQVFGGNAKLFELEASSTGNCVSGNCVAGKSISQVPRMYLEDVSAQEYGAFSVYVRARLGSFADPAPVISVCQAPLACADGTRIDFTGVPRDDAWHQYFIAWRQGAAEVEACSLRDTFDTAQCGWAGTGKALGSTFGGTALWSTVSYRSDFGAELWFDELLPAVTVELSSTEPDLTNAGAIGITATFSAPVTGFDLSDVAVQNGAASNLIAQSTEVYDFEVVPSGDGLVVVELIAGAAEDENGTPTAPTAPLERTVDQTPPELAITGGPENGTTTTETVAAFTFEADAPAECALDGAAFAPCTDSFVAENLSLGAHVFEVRATDEAGNQSAESRTWEVVSNEPPPPSGPTDKEQCKHGGWKTFTNPPFKNQGDCVSYVATGGKKPYWWYVWRGWKDAWGHDSSDHDSSDHDESDHDSSDHDDSDRDDKHGDTRDKGSHSKKDYSHDKKQGDR